MAHLKELEAALPPHFKRRLGRLAAFEQRACPRARSTTSSRCRPTPRFQAREMVVEVEHPSSAGQDAGPAGQVPRTRPAPSAPAPRSTASTVVKFCPSTDLAPVKLSRLKRRTHWWVRTPKDRLRRTVPAAGPGRRSHEHENEKPRHAAHRLRDGRPGGYQRGKLPPSCWPIAASMTRRRC